MMGRLLGKLISTVVVGGAIAAGVAYALEKMEYKKDIKKDFEEFEDDFEDEDFSDVEIADADAAATAAEPAQGQETKTATDDDFVDEGKAQAEPETAACESAETNPKYVSLNTNKEKFTQAAKDTFDAAKVLAGAAIDMAKDMGGIVKDESGKLSSEMTSKFGQAAGSAKESAEKMIHKFDKAAQDVSESAETAVEEAAETDEACECAKIAPEEAPASTVTISEE